MVLIVLLNPPSTTDVLVFLFDLCSLSFSFCVYGVVICGGVSD